MAVQPPAPGGQARPKPPSRVDALGRCGFWVLTLFALLPLVPAVEAVVRVIHPEYFAFEPVPVSWPLAPLGMVASGLALAEGARRTQQNAGVVVLSFVEGVLVLPRVLLLLLLSSGTLH